MSLSITHLPYKTASATLFARVQHLPWALFLDSCYPHSQQGRFDLIAAFPHTTLTTYGTQSTIHCDGKVQPCTDHPFELIRNIMGPWEENTSILPFTHGALGYFSYEFGTQLDAIEPRAPHDNPLPDVALGFYDCVIVTDHHEKKRYWITHQGHANHADRAERFQQLIQTTPKTKENDFSLSASFQPQWSFQDYAHAFQQIKHHLAEGDCYQVNLTQAFTAPCQGNTWHAYQHLRKINPVPFASFMRLPEAEILSLSPERFLSVKQRQVLTQPIKGTRSRSTDLKHDRQLAQALQHSEKDQAENVMIVDLMRNDLGRVCDVGSVHVPALFHIESFPAVHHLVSTVTGRLAQGKDTLDLLQACLPGGSITGAPKIRAMQIIRAIEPYRRSIYCGTMGYIDASGHMDSNIAIRTLFHQSGMLHLAAGGAIVTDSTVESEYQECFDKINRIARALTEIKREVDANI